MTVPSAAPPALTRSHAPPAQETRLRRAARDLETAFVAEMLKASGLGRPLEGTGGGGAGEAAFASFLADLQARQVTARGGFGLAESLYRSIAGRGGVHG